MINVRSESNRSYRGTKVQTYFWATPFYRPCLERAGIKTTTNCILYTSIGEFLQRLGDNSKFFGELRENFHETYGEYPDPKQAMAWKSSLRYLGSVLREEESLKNLSILLEYKLPFSGERIDALLLGRGKSKPLAFVFELKGWNHAKPFCEDFVDTDIGRQVHPEYQLKNYVGKLRFSHSASDIYDLDGAVLMYNMERAQSRISFHGKSYYKGEEAQLLDALRERLAGPLDARLANQFVGGTYMQSKKLFEAIREHFEEIRKASYEALAEKGYGLSNEQLDVVDQILADLESGNKVVYLVRGGPGSGKTLLAIHLLLSSLAKGKSSVLTYRNNRLLNSLRKVLDKRKEGLDVPIKFYSTGKPFNPGIAEKKFEGFFDLVIYDEAQRMSFDNISYAMQRGKVLVYFYDESQILNAEESGTTENFLEEIHAQRLNVEQRSLNGYYRVLGGRQYHDWVEKLLAEPNTVERIPPWGSGYDLKVFASIKEMVDALRSRRDEDPDSRVGLIASFTESPGDTKNPKSPKNLRIGNGLLSGLDVYRDFADSIYWLMDPKKDYVPFWVNGGSNRLKECASIYGAQGFEIDYAGIVWGRDFVYREGSWEIGNYCEDNIARPSLKQILQRVKEGDLQSRELATRLLVNRYRIFLTRGIKGTYIFCEDKPTAEFLQQVLLLTYLVR
ncbi:MAG: DUF2075 domain-containing protein [Nitrososphaerota archaeon]|nr:DUF2075 domain-containing protein [Nitrososphaerota archaeon]